MARVDSERSFSRREEKRLLNLAAKVCRSDFPNPERSGCPSPKLLRSLAYRQIPLSETGEFVEHIATCSPCFQDYWRYRRRHKRRTATTAVVFSLGVLASIGIVITGHRLWFQTGSNRQQQALARDLVSQPTYSRVVFDLRSRSVSRSDEPREVNAEGNLLLPRSRVLLLIYPPIGSEDGIYDIQLQLPFPDVVFDPLYHADALMAAQSKLVDLSDYQAGRDLFPVHFNNRMPDELRHPLWMLEGGPADTAPVLRKVLNECPIPIDYVVLVGDRPPADRAPDFNATVGVLDSRMDLFAADSTDAFVRVYRRK